MDLISEGNTAGLWALFVSAFVSSTLLPGGSEALLYGLARAGHHEPWLLLMIASTGNTLGGMTSWLVGRIIAWRFPSHRMLATPRYQRALQRVRRWGAPALIFSWLPIVGDPLCVVAGWLRTSLPATVFFIALGKVLRYSAVLYVA
ncbi:MAG TPA: DedA family protein [Chromatiales bacterium]|nr:DedA family protein [Chromatiales bacterium]